MRLRFVVSARMVNENLPNRILHGMAKGYLENEFGFRLNSEGDFELEFGGKLLLRLGVIGGIPMYPGSTIIIRYLMKLPISGESLSMPSAKIGPSFPRDGMWARQYLRQLGSLLLGRDQVCKLVINVHQGSICHLSKMEMTCMNQWKRILWTHDRTIRSARTLSVPSFPVKPVIGRYGTRAFGDIYQYGS